MSIETVNNSGDVVVKPSGRLNSSTAGAFEEALEAVLGEEVNILTIDMSEVDFISSMGLRVLVSAYRKMGEKNLILLNPNPATAEVLRLSGLLKVFTVK